MKRITLFAVLALVAATLVPTQSKAQVKIQEVLQTISQYGKNKDNKQQTTDATTAATASSAASSSAETPSNSSLGSILGAVTDYVLGISKSPSIVGTWVYTEPAVQFESESLLAKAGGVVAGNTAVEKLTPYYEKIGITPGRLVFTFAADSTCTYTFGEKTFSANYTYDPATGKVVIRKGFLSFPVAYATSSASSLSLVFDATKILTAAQFIASTSKNANVSAIGKLSKNYKGMKTGFKFQKGSTEALR